MNTLLPVFPFRDLLCAGCCEELQDGVASGEAMIRIQMTQLHTWHKSYKKCLLFVDRTCYAAKTKLELLATLFEVNQALCHRYLVCGKRIAGPDYNPTELTFSSFKSYLKGHETVLEKLPVRDAVKIMQAAFDSATHWKCDATICHCAYE